MLLDFLDFLGFSLIFWDFLYIPLPIHTFMAYSLHFLQFSCTFLELLDFSVLPKCHANKGESRYRPTCEEGAGKRIFLDFL